MTNQYLVDDDNTIHDVSNGYADWKGQIVEEGGPRLYGITWRRSPKEPMEVSLDAGHSLVAEL